MHSDVTRRMVALRRELHRFPEVSLNESETASRVCRVLGELDIPFRRNVGGHGILAEIPGAVPKPLIALRSDMDALPVKEETGLEFASKHEGVMHACGHDGHMSMLLGAAELLMERELPRSVRLIFQPAEEVARGARAMIEAGALDDVAMIFGGHLDRHYKTGTIMITEGAVGASADRFEIEITGQAGHGARPHEATDAIVAGSLAVMALQTIVSREVDPAFPSVVSVGEFKAGTAGNVIAGEAFLSGTIRAQHPDVRQQLLSAVERIVKSICDLHGAHVDITFRSGPPPLVNEAGAVRLARQAAAMALGEEAVVEPHTVNMGGEDFSFYLQKVPGCYVRYGAQREGHEGFPAHSSRFDFDEDALPGAAAYLAELVVLAGEKLRG